MARLHLFFPENDLALAHGGAHFTPPAAARKLHRAGEILPLWYSDADDRVITSGINAEWLDNIRRRFNIEATIFNRQPKSQLVPYPWGWSEASCQVYRNFQVDEMSLPGDFELDEIRHTSHRARAAEVTRHAQSLLDFDIAPEAIEVHDENELYRAICSGAPMILKTPWSSSGRGLITTRNNSISNILRQAEGIFRRQYSIMVEHEWDKVLDFALLYERETNGTIRYVGLSLFETNERGAYIGNSLAAPEILHARLAAQFPALPKLIEAFRTALADIAHSKYIGPLGVDMMLIKSPTEPQKVMAAVCEVNVRMTMGRVAHEFAVRHLAEGSEGTYQVLPTAMCPRMERSPEIVNGKLVCGELDLTPPNADFTFRVCAKC
jgi:hypothetical protein